MVSCDSGLPPDTQNTLGTSGNVFESLRAREGPSLALFENSRDLASSSCGLGLGNTVEHWKGVRRDPRSSSIPNPRLNHGNATLSPLSHTGGTYSLDGVMDYPRFQISEMHLHMCTSENG